MKTSVDLWTPLQGNVEWLPRSTHPLFILGRLAEGATHPAAQSEMSAIAADLERAFPENAARGVHLEPLETVVFGPVRPALLVLLGAVGLVLLVACVNVANLLLLRAAAVVGIGLAFVGVRGLVVMAPPDVPRLALAAINVPVLLITLCVAVVAGFAFSLLPTLQVRRLNLQSSLAGPSARTSAGPRRTRLRSSLVGRGTGIGGRTGLRGGTPHPQLLDAAARRRWFRS